MTKKNITRPAKKEETPIVMADDKDANVIPGRMASKQETTASFRYPSPKIAQQAAEYLSDLFSVLDGTAVPEPETPEPDLRPVPVRRDVAALRPLDSLDFDLTSATKWHKVGHLPGYLLNTVKAMGKDVFQPFAGNYPVGDILVVSTLTNEKSEMASVLRWMQAGTKFDVASVVFNPRTVSYSLVKNEDRGATNNYTAQVQAWQVGNNRMLLVKDFAGAYIYMWPQVNDDNKLAPSPSYAKLGKSTP